MLWAVLDFVDSGSRALPTAKNESTSNRVTSSSCQETSSNVFKCCEQSSISWLLVAAPSRPPKTRQLTLERSEIGPGASISRLPRSPDGHLSPQPKRKPVLHTISTTQDSPCKSYPAATTFGGPREGQRFRRDGKLVPARKPVRLSSNAVSNLAFRGFW